MKVFVAGATGVIGRLLLPALVSSGHTVFGLSRKPESSDRIKNLGATPVICDIYQKDQLHQALEEVSPDVIVHQLTSIPPRINPKKAMRDLAETNRLRTEGTQLLLEIGRDVGASHFIVQSVSFYADPRQPGLADEEAPLYIDAPAAFAEVVSAIHEMEEMVLGTQGIRGLVLRYGYFYGPGTYFDSKGSFYEDTMKKKAPVVGKGEGVLSFLHVSDAAKVTLLAMEKGVEGIFHVVDDEPVTIAEWFPWYAGLIGAPTPMKVPKIVARMMAGPFGIFYMTQQRGASNRKAKETLDWTPQYPSWKDGFRQEFNV